MHKPNQNFILNGEWNRGVDSMMVIIWVWRDHLIHDVIGAQVDKIYVWRKLYSYEER